MAKEVVDIGILTIRDDEFAAILEAFPESKKVAKGPSQREYSLRTASFESGDYRIAILRQIEQGNGEAQDAARDMIDDWSPRLIVVAGIAGGLPSEDFTLGDVIASSRIIDYTVQARKAKEQTTYSQTGGAVSKAIAGGLANLTARDEMSDWSADLPERPKFDFKKFKTYGPKNWQDNVKESVLSHKKTWKQSPIFRVGNIASSDVLVKDPEVVIPLLSANRHLLAVEMESGGVYRAARERCTMVAIRGISDVIGLKRSDSFTKYACLTAAAFCRAYLSTKPVEPKSTQKKKGQSKSKKAAVTYSNLIPLISYPEDLYIAAATITKQQKAWAVLRTENTGQVPGSWVIRNGTFYSLTELPDSRLRWVIDEGSIEAHETCDWTNSEDQEEQSVFLNLIYNSLRDDLFKKGVRYRRKDNLFYFSGWPDDGPRKYRYRAHSQKSEMTVVSHRSTDGEGKSWLTLRHLAFKGRFRQVEDRWYLEVVPSYLFTTDGKYKHRFHEEQLKKIKRLEKNRSVISQVLLWAHLLKEKSGKGQILEFGEPVVFE